MKMGMKMADLWVVAGAPGSGKSTASAILLDTLNPHPALLDKDTLYGSFVHSVLAAAEKPDGEREGTWYDEHIKVHEYSGLTAAAKEIRSHGCPVLLSAPFTTQIHNAEKWYQWVEQLGGGNVRLVWIQTDKETLRKRLTLRNSARDVGKLENFDSFIEYMQIDSPPPVDHIVIDNRDIFSNTLQNQIDLLIKNN